MDVFSLAARITLDTNEYEKALGDAGAKTHSFGEKLKSGLAAAAKVGAAGLAAATTAVGALSKAALDSYGDYEQLTGGVETLFKTSADVVMEYANNAYQTAGLSANEYMETVTSFSASLLQSLGGDTEAAAEYADMAIRDMSDNANKMGTDMEMIQNAYRGFSRANFTMLDNLALGYGGTKEEMERLLADAEKLSGVKYDISSYSDMIEAIHVVQTEMGITGTTAKEAATTIQGSVAAAKSAWSNLVTGIADENADLGQLVSNLVTSVETAAGNIIPRISQILSGMKDASESLIEQVPGLQGIANALNVIIPLVATAAGGFAAFKAGMAIQRLVQGFQSAQVAISLLSMQIGSANLAQAALNGTMTIGETIVALLTGKMSLATLAQGAMTKAQTALNAALNANPIAIVITVIGALVAALVTLYMTNEDFRNKVNAVWAEIKDTVSGVVNSVATFFTETVPNAGRQMLDFFKSIPSMALQWGKDLIDNFVGGIKAKIQSVKDAVSNVASTVKNFIGFSEPEEGPLSNFHTYAPDMMQLFAKGITDNAGLLKNAFDKSLDFGSTAIDFPANYAGNNYIGSASTPRTQSSPQNSGTGIPPITIVVQSVLDGKVIGETSYNYIHNRERAYGGAY